ncbi:TlpA disulfide reductase family protein [Nocardia sp. PE-7]|uniref:TlpA family protein disulfide reductase n=1 Tax=Nocardia sp. PE-7 TaxID=3058426 RepID=UPI00265B1654|nr:TlpA disulfide reductase family protein [Nocardia sp. PE-7]WKG09896.1 TlpA disulfide reductase family protein [Nocardia sp. PE-7]
MSEPSLLRRPALRWVLAAVILLAAATVALWPRESAETAETAGTVSQTSPQTSGVSAEERAAAGSAPCPAPATAVATGSGPLAGLTLSCLADGKPIDLAAVLAGKPALLNLWAYWCGPCAVELPHLQEFAQRAGSQLTVMTVHSDPDEAKALSRLSGLGITLPGVEDPQAAVRSAVGAPAVLPVSVLVRADGTIASVEVRTFADVADIADTVAAKLGVTV